MPASWYLSGTIGGKDGRSTQLREAYLRSTWFGLRAEIVGENRPAQLHGESCGFISLSYRRNAGTMSTIYPELSKNRHKRVETNTG